MGVCVSKGEILSELNVLKICIIGFSILFLLVGGAIVYIIANSISRGIKSTSKHLNLLAEGDLCQEVLPKYLQIKDEVGAMTNSMKVMQESYGYNSFSSLSILSDKALKICIVSCLNPSILFLILLDVLYFHL